MSLVRFSLELQRVPGFPWVVVPLGGFWFKWVTSKQKSREVDYDFPVVR